ncbi:hypothetical protein BD289DRAFT_112429 [Coniella lustricola]|uniref:Uncharacterized protein n=1 Tax=Coniella lustricola TaxID=2025994 RepID=A0A2T3AGA3_9PEZI|nr:hypothetical protein BD289DRAFT_112429 [Coniella lustricola]
MDCKSHTEVKGRIGQSQKKAMGCIVLCRASKANDSAIERRARYPSNDGIVQALSVSYKTCCAVYKHAAYIVSSFYLCHHSRLWILLRYLQVFSGSRPWLSLLVHAFEHDKGEMESKRSTVDENMTHSDLLIFCSLAGRLFAKSPHTVIEPHARSLKLTLTSSYLSSLLGPMFSRHIRIQGGYDGHDGVGHCYAA